MSRMLSVYWPALDKDQIEWRLTDLDKTLISGSGTPELMKKALVNQQAGQVELWLGGEDVLWTTIKPPTKSRALLKTAAPYLVEEYLAQNADNVHWVLGKASSGGLTEICIIDAVKFKRVLDKLESIGLFPDVALPDFAAFDVAANELLIWSGGKERYLLRSGFAAIWLPKGFASSGAFAFEVLMQMSNSIFEPPLTPKIKVRSAKVQTLDAIQKQLPQWQLEQTEVRADNEGELALIDQIKRQSTGKTLNLCQGQYAHKKHTQRSSWALTAALLAGWLIFVLIVTLVKIVWLNLQTSQVKDEGKAFYQRHFPEEATPPDDLLRAIDNLDNGKNSADYFLKMLNLFAGQFNQIAGSNAQIESVRYSHDTNEMNIELNLDSFEALERLTEALSDKGVTTAVVLAQQKGQGIGARLRLEIPEGSPGT